jgi:hypothetical protein
MTHEPEPKERIDGGITLEEFKKKEVEKEQRYAEDFNMQETMKHICMHPDLVPLVNRADGPPWVSHVLENGWIKFIRRKFNWHWKVKLHFSPPTMDIRSARQCVEMWIYWLEGQIQSPCLPYYFIVPGLFGERSILYDGLLYLGPNCPVDEKTAQQKWHNISEGDAYIDFHCPALGGPWYTGHPQ